MADGYEDCFNEGDGSRVATVLNDGRWDWRTALRVMMAACSKLGVPRRVFAALPLDDTASSVGQGAISESRLASSLSKYGTLGHFALGSDFSRHA